MSKCLCQHCKKERNRQDLTWVKDRYGIPYKLVCDNCFDEVEESINRWEFDESYAGERLYDY
jgi:predicted 3-demethylubiquinone-9 3-methyltransferase (glyoxalase superfamily)